MQLSTSVQKNVFSNASSSKLNYVVSPAVMPVHNSFVFIHDAQQPLQ